MANRRAPDHCEFYEEPIPLHDIMVKVNVGEHYLQAHVANTGELLTMTPTPNGAVANIPKIETSAIIVFDQPFSVLFPSGKVKLHQVYFCFRLSSRKQAITFLAPLR